jgi:uncharacterized protein (UPF0335 family)
MNGGTAGILRSFIHRVESMDEEIKAAKDDRKEIFAEAKMSGFDPAIMREVVKLRKMDPQKKEERDALVEIYMRAMNAPDDLAAAIREVVKDGGSIEVSAHA